MFANLEGMPGPEATVADRLKWATTNGPKHFRPIAYACLHHNARLTIVPQGNIPFEAVRGLPNIIMIGDDLATAMGPAAFHVKSLRRYIPTVRFAVIVSCEPLVELYAMAALPMALGFNTLLVESRPEQERAWANLIWDLNPDVSIAIGKVEGSA